MGSTRYNPRALLVAGLGLVALAVTLFLPPVVQWKDYHALADTRGFRCFPNALNVLSNLPFLVVGLLGLRFLSKPSDAFLESWERWPYAVLMASFILVGCGSSYYHWNPCNRTLFWDRVPLALIFSSILGITLIERVSLRGGALSFFPLLATGVASVIYWHLGNSQGRGDLRFYVLIQAGAVLAVPLLVVLFPPRYTGGRELFLVVALYGLAKVFETVDSPVYHVGHFLSGHTIKHLLAGLAAWKFLSMLRHRRPAGPPLPAAAMQPLAAE